MIGSETGTRSVGLKADCVRLLGSVPPLGTASSFDSDREVVGKSRAVGGTRVGPQRASGMGGGGVRVGSMGVTLGLSTPIIV